MDTVYPFEPLSGFQFYITISWRRVAN